MEFQSLANRVLEGGAVTRDEAREILNAPDEALMPLLEAARRVREKAFGRDVILHVLRNAKSGACPEDCNFCSQSTKYQSDVERYRIQSVDELMTGAREAYAMGATRYCMVTSTRAPSAKELEVVCEATRRIKAEMPLQICTSLGFLDGNSALQLAAAGVDRFNHNLETSERHFPSVVSSHGYQDRVDTVRAAKDAGMQACCGGIIGLGETVEDRVDLAFSLRELEVESIPLNFLDPRPGTPMADTARPTTEDCLRTLAMMRFVNPESDLRIAGGREKALGEKQGLALYPANSLFTEGYLTTGGQGYTADMEMIEAAGFRVSVVMPH
jgi:biotin synthase